MSERETMNGSAQQRKHSSACVGWASRRERQRADAERVEGVAAVGGGAPNFSSRMSCVAVVVESVGSRNVSAPADRMIPLTR
jgi:hypothetical protein